MGTVYDKLLRPWLFRKDPEEVHEVLVKMLGWASSWGPLCRTACRLGRFRDARVKPIEAFGLTFPNAVGLAAGFDKNGVFWPLAEALGFGHVEIGTVTRYAQPGNPKPRIFRYPEHRALINRMGFNNFGADSVAMRLAGQIGVRNRRIPLGVNLGKSKATPLDEAVEDYLYSFRKLAGFADYIVINISSPNTPDLRRLQEEDRLIALLAALCDANREHAEKEGDGLKPILLKIAPDLNYRQIDRIIELALSYGLAGLIATNTTLDRPSHGPTGEQGGLSGDPLRRRSTEIVSYICRSVGSRLPVIASGGVMDEVSASEKLNAGACLVQIYTGWVYGGPWFPRRLARNLALRYR